MKTFTITTVAGLSALAQAVEFTNSNFDVVPGEDFDITWSGAEGPVTISLRQGDSDDLTTLDEVASDVSGDSFTWTVPDNLPEGDDYALEINDGSGEPNYSEQFSLSGGEADSDDGDSETSAISESAIPSESEAPETSEAVETSSPVESSSAVESEPVSEPISSDIAEETSEVSSEVPTSSEEASASASESETATETDDADASDADDDEAEETDVPDSKAGHLGSPVALILTFAAMLYF